MVDLEIIEFANQHKNDNIHKLVLTSNKYPGIDVKLAAMLITAKKKIGKKVPCWEEKEGLYFPCILPVEQASSQITAEYKKRFVNSGIVLDITGGLGVDSFFLSQKAKQLFYFEKNKEIYEAAKFNFNYLNITNISLLNAEISKESFSNNILPYADLIYVDPARRDGNTNKVKAISDYHPNILDIKDDLFKRTNSILVKVSPMVDISATIEQIPEVAEVHVISVNNECKELLFLLFKNRNNNQTNINDIQIFTVNFCKDNRIECFNFSFRKEHEVNSHFSGDILSKYMYEPNSSILKAGAFKTLGEHFGIAKLNKSTHLYTTSILINDFPGRRFVIKDQLDFKKEIIKKFRSNYPKANVSTRNFPLTPEELKKLLRINDGGNIYIFGCKVFSGEKKLLICIKDS